jgi:hypothetical protein
MTLLALECLAGVHGLRAICRTIASRSKQDAAVKLLFQRLPEDITGRTGFTRDAAGGVLQPCGS